jgi:Chaperone of endosialidase/Secretion system C-terminal sorting domain
VRVTSVNAPTRRPDNTYGVYNPAGLTANTTRVSISYDPNIPVTRPLSLLHLGYNTGLVGIGITDGWRSWMDIGTFTSNGTDNMYIGLKQEVGIFPANDRQDAVVSWGDNNGVNPLNGPDNLRFIFTQTQTGFGNTPANTNNGLEVARMEPQIASTIAVPNPLNFGMMGIGDFSPLSPNAIAGDVVDAKLDIDGDLRIRQVTEDSNLVQVLVIDSNDLNRVHWRDISTLGGVGNITANNGLSIDPGNPTNVQLGQELIGLPAFTGAASLLQDREIPLDGFNLIFSGLGTQGTDRFSVGDLPTTNNSKFNVYSESEEWNTEFYTDNTAPVNINFQGGIYSIIDNVRSNGAVAVVGELKERTSAPIIDRAHIGVFGKVIASFIKVPVGVRGLSEKGGMGGLFVSNSLGLQNGSLGLRAEGVGSTSGNTAILAIANNNNLSGSNIGVSANVFGNTTLSNIGVRTSAAGLTTVNYGIHATALGIGNFAGWFEGDVWINGPSQTAGLAMTVSDQMFKTNVDSISNPLNIIEQLRPKTFFYDTTNAYGINFSGKRQYGFIAQDLELVLPELVGNTTKPAAYDTLGNMVTSSVTFKNVNYNAFFGLLTAAIQKQQNTIDSLMNAVETLTNCVNEANLCNGAQARLGNSDNEGTVVELENLNAIILDQNLPNPFKEKTTINYTLPEEVKEAQLLFYDLNGRIIKQVNITERGDGKLTVYGENLKNGIYTYSLIADGKLIATKKMVKQ